MLIRKKLCHSQNVALKYGLGIHIWDIPVSKLSTKAGHVSMIQILQLKYLD